jgi:EAL domain-containing protein (putative c-di-GMP-specific phosphodiesterase class I)
VFSAGGLRTLFQPILELETGRTRAVECLSRGPRGSALESPALLFELARERGEEAALDRTCVLTALDAATVLGEVQLSVNVHASTLAVDPGFPSFLRDALDAVARPRTSLIVEIVEHTPAWDQAVFRGNLEALRSSGFRIALDDVGLGYSNYQMILETSPDLFKVDRYFVRGLERDDRRRAVLESIVQLAARFGGKVVAEGVESEEALAVLRELGVPFGQGFLFLPPISAAALLETEFAPARD